MGDKAKEYTEKEYYKVDNVDEFNGEPLAVYRAYTQCQEDMADYIFKVAKEFHRLGKYSGNTSDTHFTDIYKETINSLNKQDK